jgi:hypothetical protein
MSIRAHVRMKIILLSNNRIGVSRYHTGHTISYAFVKKEALITHKTSVLHAFIICIKEEETEKQEKKKAGKGGKAHSGISYSCVRDRQRDDLNK